MKFLAPLKSTARSYQLLVTWGARRAGARLAQFTKEVAGRNEADALAIGVSKAQKSRKDEVTCKNGKINKKTRKKRRK